ncbi:hypothetical protein V8F20_006246 [Naviculisporaceae sp. PSN 640]
MGLPFSVILILFSHTSVQDHTIGERAWKVRDKKAQEYNKNANSGLLKGWAIFRQITESGGRVGSVLYQTLPSY